MALTGRELVGAFQVRLGGGQEPVVFLARGGLEAALTKTADKDRKAGSIDPGGFPRPLRARPMPWRTV
jgi:hypothetical protein